MSAPAPAAALPPHTKDGFLGGRVMLLQPQKGHRAGLDAALLQAVVPSGAKGLLVDMGAGVGTVAFAAAARAPALQAVVVERERGLLAFAEAALRLPENAGIADRVRPVAGDAGDTAALRTTIGDAFGRSDWVLMNPPFDTPNSVRVSPDAGRRTAHLAEVGLLAGWRRTAADLLRPGGMLALIHRAAALPAVLETLAPGFGALRVMPVYPHAGEPASRVLVSAVRGSRAPFALLPGLVLHAPGGAWTDEADAVLRGETALAPSH